MLRDVTVAYETWGELDADGANAVLVCHALTGDSHAAGGPAPGHPTPGWWDGLIGPGRALDTDRYFVVCVNVLGGCQGTTGPASLDPGDGPAVRLAFPVVSIRDMVRTQAAVADDLGIARWLAVVGGSMGGMQVLEWGGDVPRAGRVARPHRHRGGRQRPADRAGGASGRQAIRLDPRWRGGDYYDAAPGDGPHEGLALARMIAQITYRTDDVFTDRFGRERGRAARRLLAVAALPGRALPRVPRRQARPPLRRQHLPAAHQGHGPARHRPRPGRRRARRWPASPCPTLVDGRRLRRPLPAYQQRAIAEACAARRPASYVEIDSPHGHDAFLIELDQVGAASPSSSPTVEKHDA